MLYTQISPASSISHHYHLVTPEHGKEAWFGDARCPSEHRRALEITTSSRHYHLIISSLSHSLLTAPPHPPVLASAKACRFAPPPAPDSSPRPPGSPSVRRSTEQRLPGYRIQTAPVCEWRSRLLLASSLSLLLKMKRGKRKKRSRRGTSGRAAACRRSPRCRSSPSAA
jgi:hypothetical protein